MAVIKLLFILLGSILLSACSTGVNEEAFRYSFHAIDYGHTMDGEEDLELTIEEEGKVFTKHEVKDLELNLSIVNLSGETLDIGSDIKIERFEKGSWELVETPEEYTEDAVLISIPHENVSEYIVSIEDRFLAEDELTGGTYRINNNDAFHAYFVVSEFIRE